VSGERDDQRGRGGGRVKKQRKKSGSGERDERVELVLSKTARNLEFRFVRRRNPK
jgi:hypothetical protein